MYTKNQDTGLREFNIHHYQVTATGISAFKPMSQISDVGNEPISRSKKDALSSIYVVEGTTPSFVQALSEAFGCGSGVFNDHLKRASEDVEIVLPSIRQSQSHVVIPYRRTYLPSRRRLARDSRNLKSSFSHGGLITTEEHVTC